MQVRGFSVRSSGRDLTAVRRPVKAAAPVAVEAERPSGDARILGDLKKAELVEIAEERGVDTSGTKADLLSRLGVPE